MSDNPNVKVGSWIEDGSTGLRTTVIAIVTRGERNYAAYRKARDSSAGSRINYVRLDRIGNGRKNSWKLLPETV